ncbi:DNA-binding protein [Methylobacterium currus]|uniref:DNA-binding protein n=1 Tax=Methylobacterium currus TaxID=2051553 RepID=UPI001E54380A|nr:DNA-binding protein [Methylobacterium currus]UHC19449.1 DNA-binding protein [Methylobacterium currus]
MVHLNSTGIKCPTEERKPVAKRLYSVEEFRAAYGLSRARTYEEINDGRLIARRLGGRTFIADCDAEAWKNALPTHRPSRVQRAA